MSNPTYYTEDQKAFILQHHNVDMTMHEIAEALGISYRGLRRHTGREREKGMPLTPKKAFKVGDFTTRKRKGGTAMYLRTEAGWKYHSCTLDAPDKRQYNGRHNKYPNKPLKATKQPKQPNTQPMPTRHSQTIRNDRKLAVKVKRVARPALVTDRNPANVKIKSDAWKLENGYQWVYLDKKTKVLRAPHKLTA